MASSKSLSTTVLLVTGLILTVTGSPAPGLYLAPWTGHGTSPARAHRYPPVTFKDYNPYEYNPEIVNFEVIVKRSEDRAECVTKTKELVLTEGKLVRLQAEIQAAYGSIEKAKCTYNNGDGEDPLGKEYNRDNQHEAWFQDHKLTKDMYGLWRCKLNYNKDTHRGLIQPMEPNYSYSYVICNITITNPATTMSPPNPTTPKPIQSEQDDQDLPDTEEGSDDKLKVGTSGSSSPQETHFALSLVPLLRAQPPAARLDTETAILSYFKRLGQQPNSFEVNV